MDSKKKKKKKKSNGVSSLIEWWSTFSTIYMTYRFLPIKVICDGLNNTNLNYVQLYTVALKTLCNMEIVMSMYRTSDIVLFYHFFTSVVLNI